MKKGFLFYLGLFILIIFGAMIVGLVILMFSPGTSILGFQYFSNAETKVWETTTDDSNTPLNIGENGKYSKIVIESGYAKVSVSKSNAYKKNGIVFVNNAKGFAYGQSKEKPSFSILADGSVLNIKVVEQKGFLMFSQHVEIIVHIADQEANPFANTEFEIKTGSGMIDFGGNESSAYYDDIVVGKIKAKTESGTVSINKKVNFDNALNTQNFSGLNLDIGNGKYVARAQTIKSTTDVVLQSANGKFELFNFEAPRVAIKTVSGVYKIADTKASDIVIECNKGYFYMNNIVGNVSFPSNDMKTGTPYMETEKLEGDLTIVEGNDMLLKVTEITGNVHAVTESGSLYFGKDGKGGVAGSMILQTKSGRVDAVIKDGNNNAKYIKTNSGSINLTLLGQVLGNTRIDTTNGHTSVKFHVGKAYTFDFAYPDKLDAFDMKKVNFKDFPKIEMVGGHYIYNADVPELQRGGVEIYTNGNVTLALVNPEK